MTPQGIGLVVLAFAIFSPVTSFDTFNANLSLLTTFLLMWIALFLLAGSAFT